MKQGLKRWSLAAAAVTAVLATAGLTGASARPSNQVTLTMEWVNTGQAAMQSLISNFEAAYPNVQVQATYLPSGTLATLVPTQLQAGNAPDLIYVTPGGQKVGSVWPLAADGRLLDLSGQPWFKRMGGRTEQLLSEFQGRVYAWPTGFIPDFVVYNTDLFSQLHLKIPTTFQQLLTMCQTIKGDGKYAFAQGFNDTGTWSIISRMLYEQTVFASDPNWSAKRTARLVTFSGTSGWHLALQRLVDMNNAGCFEPGAAGINRPSAYPIFANGQSVMMMIAGSEMPSITAINPNLHYAFFNPPFAFNPAAQVVAAPASTELAVNKATQNPTEAKEFINFAARPAQSTSFNEISVSLSTYDVQRGIVPSNMGALAPLFKAGKYRVGDESFWTDPTVYQTDLEPAIQGLITGQATVDGTLAQMDTDWNKDVPQVALANQILPSNPKATSTKKTSTKKKK